MPRPQYAKGSSKATKPVTERTVVERTPVAIRSDEKLGAAFEQRIRKQLATRIGHAAGLLERLTVRFEDVNGPKGGIDIVCKIKADVSRRPSIVVQKRAEDQARAFASAVDALGVAIDRMQRKHGLATGRPRTTRAPATRTTAPDSSAMLGRPRTQLARTSRATSVLEESSTRPSRKSTRRSANRGKPSQSKERAAHATLQTPRSRASRRS